MLRALQESEFRTRRALKTIRVDVRLNRGDQQRPQTRDRRRRPARGPVLPLERRAHAPAVAPRERSTDIPLLVKHFIDKFNARLKKNVSGLEADTEAHLVAYPWPGNIRELENVIERAKTFSDGGELKVPRPALGSAGHLRRHGHAAKQGADTPPRIMASPLRTASQEQVKAAMESAGTRADRQSPRSDVRATSRKRAALEDLEEGLAAQDEGAFGLRERDDRTDS